MLRPGGLVAIDSGSRTESVRRTVRIFEPHGLRAVSFAKSCWLDRFTQIGLVKPAPART